MSARHLEERAGSGTPLTVCHLFSGDLWAGAEVVIFNLLSCLAQDPGLRVVALSLNEGVLTERLRAAGVTTHVVPESRHNMLGLVEQAAAVLKGHSVGVLHSHRYKENVLAWLLAKRLGVSEVVTTIHGLPEAPQNRGDRAQALGWRRRLDYVLVRTCFSAAVAVSEEMKRALVHRHGFTAERVQVIRNGGRFPEPLATPRTGVFHVGTVGRMVPIKGFDLFLEVAVAVRREMPAVRFSILGDGPLKDELTRMAVALKIDDGVEFMSPRPDPFTYYRALDLYLTTSVHEGLPLSVVEAMACGKPVVSAAVGGIPEIVRDGEEGFLVAGRDPAPFARRCLELLRDDRLRTRMGQRAEASARSHLSAEAMAAGYRRLYDGCSARMRRGSADTNAKGDAPRPRAGAAR